MCLGGNDPGMDTNRKMHKENSYNEDNLRITNGKYKSSKKNSDRHGYGLKIINGIAEKYNGILSVQVRGGFFAVTTTLCLDENNE